MALDILVTETIASYAYMSIRIMVRVVVFASWPSLQSKILL